MPEGVVVTRRDPAAMRFRVENPRGIESAAPACAGGPEAPLIAFQEVPQALETVYLRVMAGRPHERRRAQRMIEDLRLDPCSCAPGAP